MKCRMCKSVRLDVVLDLGNHPPSDAFLTLDDFDKPEPVYPLVLMRCDNCGLFQLSYTVPREILFNGNYPYTTGSNKHGVSYYRNLAKYIYEKFNLDEKSVVVDIGSNDGTLLSGFQRCNVIGFEPCSNIAALAKVPTINEFFGEISARKLAKQCKANVITATNVFAHVEDLDDFMLGVRTLLADDGVFIIEAPSFDDLVINLAYDTIYHEHLCYLTPSPLSSFMKRYELELFHVEHSDIHGGSYRYFISKPGLYDNDVIQNGSPSWGSLESKVMKHRDAMRNMLGSLKGKVVGISAPAKGNTLINYCKLASYIDYIVESSEHKIGKFCPGSHVFITTESRLLDADYGIVFAWNFKDQIIENSRKAGFRGDFIIPLPEPHII